MKLKIVHTKKNISALKFFFFYKRRKLCKIWHVPRANLAFWYTNINIYLFCKAKYGKVWNVVKIEFTTQKHIVRFSTHFFLVIFSGSKFKIWPGNIAPFSFVFIKFIRIAPVVVVVFSNLWGGLNSFISSKFVSVFNPHLKIPLNVVLVYVCVAIQQLF